MTDLKQTLLIPDTHIDQEDKRAYDLMLWIASELQGGKGPDEILILGDYGDFYSVSSHAKSANAERHLVREVDAVNARLDELDAAWPEATKKFIQGNHEFRLERYINAKAPELFGVTDTQKILKLKERGWDYVPYTPDQLTQVGKSKLYARHEPLQGGTLPAHGTAIKAGCSVVYGHIHTIQQSQVVMANGDEHLGISVGWLGDKRKDAFDYVKTHHQWSLGFGVCTWDPKTGLFFVDTVRIFDYQALCEGKWYHG